MQMEFRYRFEAAHRFLSSQSVPCMTPHGHSWYATLGLKFVGQSLNASQMTVEFSEMKKDWRKLTQELFDHSYMHHYNDPVVEVLGSEARLLPFPGDPTTELVALLMFNKMEMVLKANPIHKKVEIAFIKIEETPTNSLVCQRDFYLQEISKLNQYSGWWTCSDLEDRTIVIKS